MSFDLTFRDSSNSFWSSRTFEDVQGLLPSKILDTLRFVVAQGCQTVRGWHVRVPVEFQTLYWQITGITIRPFHVWFKFRNKMSKYFFEHQRNAFKHFPGILEFQHSTLWHLKLNNYLFEWNIIKSKQELWSLRINDASVEIIWFVNEKQTIVDRNYPSLPWKKN